MKIPAKIAEFATKNATS